MSSIDVLWLLGEGVLLLGLLGLFLYERYWHPAWRKERRVIGACQKAFGADGYLLERLHIHPVGPTGADLLSGLRGSSGPLLYFTYNVETVGEDPDFSRMSPRQISLVRRYLHSSGAMPHYERGAPSQGENGSLHPRGPPDRQIVPVSEGDCALPPTRPSVGI